METDVRGINTQLEKLTQLMIEIDKKLGGSGDAEVPSSPAKNLPKIETISSY